jgi:hypothetical protein
VSVVSLQAYYLLKAAQLKTRLCRFGIFLAKLELSSTVVHCVRRLAALWQRFPFNVTV